MEQQSISHDFGRKKMKGSCIDKMIGKYCKIVTREPGDKKSRVIFGKVTDIDHTEGFLVVESNDGIGCINLDIVEAIKPRYCKEIV